MYAAGLPITLTPSTFSEYASNPQRFYIQALSSLSGVLPTHIRQLTTAIEETSPLMNQPPAIDPMLSSLRLVDRYLKPDYGDVLEISDVRLGVEMLTQQLEIHFRKWQGRLTPSACYNKSCHIVKYVRGFLERISSVSDEELQINLG